MLSDQVANKIAAGEVVDRPASVVKELMENSIDAGAKFIEVEVLGGGTKLMSITDDGCGMDRDNVLMSIERHATSKIRDVNDIEQVRTMGFRGEALAAIASVSRFSLRSRRREDMGGTELTIDGGRLLDVADAGMPPGTTIAVKNLFFNVPARRKFLRAEQTELSHIRQIFFTYALAHPGLGLKLTAEGKCLWDLPATEDLLPRLRMLYDASMCEGLRPFEGAKGSLRVRGYVSLPSQARKDRSAQYVFINGRPASAPVIAYAVREAGASALPKGKHPQLFLFIEMDPELVDVNVHPAKKEVRFRQPTVLRDLLIRALTEAWCGPVSIPAHREEFTLPEGLEERVLKQSRSVEPLVSPARPGPAQRLPVAGRAPLVAESEEQVAASVPAEMLIPTPAVLAPQPTQRELPIPKPSPTEPLPAAAPKDHESDSLNPWGDYRIIGRLAPGYVLLENADGLVVLDPRAAHERVIYERLMREMNAGKVSAQGLLPPENIELPPEEARRVRANLELLRETGWDIEEFGADSFLVEALPICFGQLSARAVLSDVAAAFEKGGGRAARRWDRDALLKAICFTAVGRGAALDEREIAKLICDLGKTELPYTSPRGRPTVIFTSFQELARKFGLR